MVDGPVDGARNMALDRAVQLAVEAGEAPPTLRLYRWKRPTVSLGRFQPVDGVDLDAAEELGCDVVRRFTGGRGVLHDDELTYAVIARTSDGVPRGVAGSYLYLCEALAEAYRRIGIDAAVNRGDRHASASAACYLANTRADLSLGARKLSGSAQVWHGSTVLQHGSFTVSRDVGRDARIFRLEGSAAARLEDFSATILSATGARPSVDDITNAVTSAFGDTLGVALVRGRAVLEEENRVEPLLAEVRLVRRRGYT